MGQAEFKHLFLVFIEWTHQRNGGDGDEVRSPVCVWARINYGRSNQVIMQSRQQPAGKKLITAPDRRRRRQIKGRQGERRSNIHK